MCKLFLSYMKAFFSSLALLALMGPLALKAEPIMVTSSVTGSGSLFSYNFTVINTSLPNLLSVTLTTPAQASAVQGLTAPTGFSAFFDAGLGLVDFVSNTRPFSVGSSVSGFTFQSPFQLASTPFSALSLDSNQNPVTTTGTVTPAIGAVPEPGTLGIVGAALVVAFCIYRRRLA